MELSHWKGKVAVVTGVSSGIGEAVVRRLARAGIRIVGCARREDRLAVLADELAGSGADVWMLRADLRQEDDILKVFEEADSFGGVDILVNNAGLGRAASLMSGDTEAWREMLEVNVLALCIATREAVKRMQSRGGGHVVHISSMAGHRVPSGSGVYSASKYAVRALTEALRQELRAAKSPIRVTSISPGFVRTEFAANYHGDEARAEETYSRYEVLRPDDVANAVAYALSQPAHAQIHDILMRPTDQTS